MRGLGFPTKYAFLPVASSTGEISAPVEGTGGDDVGEFAGADDVVEDDLDRPRPDQVRRALDRHGRKGDQERLPMRPEDPGDEEVPSHPFLGSLQDSGEGDAPRLQAAPMYCCTRKERVSNFSLCWPKCRSPRWKEPSWLRN